MSEKEKLFGEFYASEGIERSAQRTVNYLTDELELTIAKVTSLEVRKREAIETLAVAKKNKEDAWNKYYLARKEEFEEEMGILYKNPRA